MNQCLEVFRLVHARDISLDDDTHAEILLIDYRDPPDPVLLHLLLTGFQRVLRKARYHVFGEVGGDWRDVGVFALRYSGNAQIAVCYDPHQFLRDKVGDYR